MNKTPYTHSDYNIIANIIIKFELFKDSLDKKKEIFNYFYYHSAISNKIKSSNQILEYTDEQIKGLIIRIEEINKNGSNWRLNKISSVIIQISKSIKTRAGFFIETPELLKNKRAIVNIKNNDDKCIIWALLAFLHYNDIKNKDKNQTYNYKKYWNEIKEPNNIIYPIDIQTDIKKFEKLNDIKINVFYYNTYDIEFKTLLTLYNTLERNDRVCNLLLLTEKDKDTKQVKEHLVYITDLDKLLRMNPKHEKRYLCP